MLELAFCHTSDKILERARRLAVRLENPGNVHKILERARRLAQLDQPGNVPEI